METLLPLIILACCDASSQVFSWHTHTGYHFAPIPFISQLCPILCPSLCVLLTSSCSHLLFNVYAAFSSSFSILMCKSPWKTGCFQTMFYICFPVFYLTCCSCFNTEKLELGNVFHEVIKDQLAINTVHFLSFSFKSWFTWAGGPVWTSSDACDLRCWLSTLVIFCFG